LNPEFLKSVASVASFNFLKFDGVRLEVSKLFFFYGFRKLPFFMVRGNSLFLWFAKIPFFMVRGNLGAKGVPKSTGLLYFALVKFTKASPKQKRQKVIF
jgi:hypothetical protein